MDGCDRWRQKDPLAKVQSIKRQKDLTFRFKDKTESECAKEMQGSRTGRGDP